MAGKTLAYHISGYNRKRKYELFKEVFPIQKEWKVLDIGISEREYSDTDNFLEKHYPYTENITGLGIETMTEFKKKYPHIKVMTYDGKIFPFQSKEFDIAWSNAVLEHVGDLERQILFIKEILRTNKRAFITTPNRCFPIEVHTRLPFIHWLPKKIADTIFKLLGKSWATGDYMHLCSKKRLKKILKEAKVKEYEIIRNKLFGFTLDFVIVIKNTEV